MSKSAHQPSYEPPPAVTPIVLKEVNRKGRVLRFRRSLVIEPAYDPDVGMFFVALPELCIFSGGASRNDLLEDLYEDVHIVWDLFALRDESNMTQDAKEIRRTILSMIENATRAVG